MRSTPVLAAALAIWVIAVPALALSATPAEASPRPSASASSSQLLLNIAVDDGRKTTAAGDQVIYTIRIRNLGSTDAQQLQVSQSLPAGLTLISADHNGTPHTDRVTWQTDLKAGQQATFTTVARVGTTPNEVLRLAAVACAASQGNEKPLVCAADSDLLPAGAHAQTHTSPPVSRRIWYFGAALALVVTTLTTTLMIRRRLYYRATRLMEHPGANPVASTLGTD